MKTYAIPETRELVSIVDDENGNPNLNTLIPPGKHLIDSSSAPWVLDGSGTPDPDLIWTPPTVILLVKLPPPACDRAIQTADPILVWSDTGCTRDWVIRDLTADERVAAARKIWPNTQAFLAEFTIAEMAGIGLSTDPTIAALRVMLSVWSGQIYSDDQRVETGLAALHIAGILTAERRAQIAAQP